MTVTVEQARQYVGAAASDDGFLETCISEATALVARFVGSATVPDEIEGRAVLEACSELFHRRQAPSGIAQFATVDGVSPVRVARDPMVAAYPILTPYVGTGIA